MTTLDTTAQLTLLELAKRKDPRGNLAVIAEVLAQDNEILKDAPWVEANDTFSHKIVRRLSLPQGSWRKINSGVALESSRTVEVIEAMGMLETYSQVDKDLADASPNPRHFRSLEATAFLEGLSQTLAYTVMHGDTAINPEQFTGLAPRLNDLSQNNIYNAGGTGSDLTSIYIVQWGETSAHLIYPKGSASMGVKHTDLGEVTIEDTGAYYQGYRDHFQVKCGLAVRDERCVARVANIETSGATNTFDEDHLITLLNRMPRSGVGAVIYCNATIKTQMEIKLKDKTNVNFTTENGLGGVQVLRFRGNPVHRVDQISNTESAVS